MERYRLIGAEASYYTGKVRAYLRWKGIPFDEVAGSAKVFEEVIVPRTGVRFLPVLLAPDGFAVQDSTEIIDFLEARFPEPPVYPSTPVQKLVALLFELWGDEWLVLPAMHWRWSFPEQADFVAHEFGSITLPDGTPEEQRRAAAPLLQRFGGSLPLLGVTPRTIPAIEAWTTELFDRLDAHFARHPFLLGTRPSIGDYGLMGPLYAHLGRDPVPAKLMRERAPRVAAWVARMNAPDVRGGDFLPDDAVPETLLPMLRRMFAEHWPVLVDSAEQLAGWLDENPTTPIPRVIGTHRFRVGDVEEDRVVFPYTVWMLQRVLDHVASLDAPARARVERFVEPLGGRDALRFRPRRRVRRERNRLVAD